MEIADLIVFTAIGLFTGLVGGMLGVGGSIVMIPALTVVLGPDQHLYQASAMIVNFFVVVPAVHRHRQANVIDTATVSRIMPLAVVSVVAGVGISELPLFAGAGEVYLRGLFGVFLLFVAGIDLYRSARRARRPPPTPAGAAPPGRRSQRMPWRLAAAVAVPTGIVAGMLGVGGGLLAVPLQRRLLRTPMATAIANSATIIIATSLVGAIVKNYAFMTERDDCTAPVVLAAVVIPTAVVGSLAGSTLTHRAPVRAIRVAFFLLLLLAGLRLTYAAVRSVC